MATVGSAIVSDRLRLFGNSSLCDRLRSYGNQPLHIVPTTIKESLESWFTNSEQTALNRCHLWKLVVLWVNEKPVDSSNEIALWIHLGDTVP